jgi:predicted ABC-type transport system involved in lysophospholipase L1 biosynthesis ATPase subunit
MRSLRATASTQSDRQRTSVSAGTPLSVCRNVGVVLGRGETLVTVLERIELTIHAAESVALWGRSGSGKSTLLQVIGGLLAPTTGSVDWESAPLVTLDGVTNGRLRAPGIANVFQSANLLPFFTTFENVAFAARAAGDAGPAGGPPAVARAGAPNAGTAASASPARIVDGSALSPLELLSLVGLDGKADALPSELSGGEAQRVAIARSLAQRPRLLLCDEPTGHLDSDTGDRVLGLIEALQRELGFALVVATHDPDVAARFPREVELLDGHLIRDEVRA